MKIFIFKLLNQLIYLVVYYVGKLYVNAREGVCYGMDENEALVMDFDLFMFEWIVKFMRWSCMIWWKVIKWYLKILDCAYVDHLS